MSPGLALVFTRWTVLVCTDEALELVHYSLLRASPPRRVQWQHFTDVRLLPFDSAGNGGVEFTTIDGKILVRGALYLRPWLHAHIMDWIRHFAWINRP